MRGGRGEGVAHQIFENIIDGLAGVVALEEQHLLGVLHRQGRSLAQSSLHARLSSLLHCHPPDLSPHTLQHHQYTVGLLVVDEELCGVSSEEAEGCGGAGEGTEAGEQLPSEGLQDHDQFPDTSLVLLVLWSSEAKLSGVWFLCEWRLCDSRLICF